MDFICNFPLFTIVGSLFSGVLCTMLPGKAARTYTLILEMMLAGLAASVLMYTIRTGGSFTYVMGEFPAPWGNEIRAGVLEALMALLFLVVMFASVLGGGNFLTVDIDESKQNLYYSLVNLMTAALMAMTWTNDIFTGYVFLEILTLTSCGILIVREIGRTTLAAVRYMILNLLGSGLFLLGVVLLYDVTGNLLMVPMQKEIAVIVQDPETLRVTAMAVGIITIGLGIKSGLFPFHYWMPDTYGWATPSSGSLLSALVSKSYIFLLIKIYWRVIGIGAFEELPLQNILFVLGVGGMIFGSLQAIRANNVNRMVALSSTAQIGYIYAAVGLGGTAGYTAAVFHMMAHAVTKSILFLSTPYLAAVSGNSLLFKNLQGSALKAKKAGAFFVVGAFSMIGIPVFAGFASKVQIALAAVRSGSEMKFFIMMTALAVSSMLNALYFIRTLIRIYSAPDGNGAAESAGGAVPEDDPDGQKKPAGGQGGYLTAMLILTAMNISLGLLSSLPAELIARGFGMFG